MEWKFNFFFFFFWYSEEAAHNKRELILSPNKIIFLIVYEFVTRSQDLNSDFTLRDCLFGGVKVAKNTDLAKYVYSGYGIGFDSGS